MPSDKVICACGHSAADHKDSGRNNKSGCHFQWKGTPSEGGADEWMCCPCGMSKQRLLRASMKASGEPSSSSQSKRTKR